MPPWLLLQVDAIPEVLRALGWVLWRAEPRGEGKQSKVPYCVSDPRRRASSTDPATWGTFEDAVEADNMLDDIAGIGVVLRAAAGITCVDLDRVIDQDGPDHRRSLRLIHGDLTERDRLAYLRA